MNQGRIGLWWAAWRSFGAGYLTLQVLHYPLRIVLFLLAEGSPWAPAWWGGSAAAGGAAVVAATIVIVIRAVRPPTRRWGAAAVLRR